VSVQDYRWVAAQLSLPCIWSNRFLRTVTPFLKTINDSISITPVLILSPRSYTLTGRFFLLYRSERLENVLNLLYRTPPEDHDIRAESS
jgi:hypothetical protein